MEKGNLILQHSKFSHLSPSYGMLGLFLKDQTSLDYLKRCTISSEFTQETQSIEFYIPQLCSIAFSVQKVTESSDSQAFAFQVLNLILIMCHIDLFFSHKVWFFLNSIEDKGMAMTEMLDDTMQAIENRSENTTEVLFMPSASIIHHYIAKHKLYVLYEGFYSGTDIDKTSTATVEGINRAELIKKAYILKDCEEYKEVFKDCINCHIRPDQIVIRPFISSLYDGSKLINEEQRCKKNAKLKAYTSVLKFINYLCDISYKLEEATTDKLECLTQELSKINGLLPTNAYIPFIKERIRHRVILHIPESESHIFSTKSRNPYLIACELYDPLELIPDMKEFISYQKPLVFNPTNNIMEYYNKITQHIISTPYTISFPKTVSTTVRKKSRNSIGSNIKVTDFSEAAVLFRQASIVPAIEFSELYSGNNKEIKSIEKFDPFGESFEEQSARIRKSSPYGNLKSWKLVKLIVKTNDNLIQEQFAMQLILQIKQIFDEENTNLWIYPYEIVCTGVDRGIIECINDIITLDSLKKKLNKIGIKALRDFFALYFKFQDKAKTCFASSLASYSLICYILRIKDRHNANIMIDKFGHLIHIDFGFMISNSPGNLDVDNTPFKLPQEWVDVIGTAGPFFDIFREGMINGFMAIQKHYPKIQILVEAMYNLYEDLPCFKEKQKAIEAISNRLFPVIKGRNHKRAMNRQEAAAYIDAYIDYLGLFPHQTTALELGHMICINTVAKEYIRYAEINFL